MEETIHEISKVILSCTDNPNDATNMIMDIASVTILGLVNNYVLQNGMLTVEDKINKSQEIKNLFIENLKNKMNGMLMTLYANNAIEYTTKREME